VVRGLQYVRALGTKAPAPGGEVSSLWEEDGKVLSTRRHNEVVDISFIIERSHLCGRQHGRSGRTIVVEAGAAVPVVRHPATRRGRVGGHAQGPPAGSDPPGTNRAGIDEYVMSPEVTWPVT